MRGIVTEETAVRRRKRGSADDQLSGIVSGRGAQCLYPAQPTGKSVPMELFWSIHYNPARYSATALISSSVRRPASGRMTCARSLVRVPLLKSISCCTM